MTPCRKDICLIYSLGVDYARLISFTRENPQGRLFRAGTRAMIYAKWILRSWYGYYTGVLIKRALRRVLRRSIIYCDLMRRLGLESEYCRRYTFYDEVPCEPVSDYDIDVAYADITHMIVNYNNDTVSEILDKMMEECSTYEVR